MTWGASSAIWRRKSRAPPMGSTRERRMPMGVCSRSPRRCICSRTRSKCYVGLPTSSGRKSSRRSCSLLTGALGREKQWALGAHYTAEADILKVVIPTVAEPWRDRIASCDTLDEAKAAQRDLMEYVVLDPACGSGNFLYVAYRELRRIEAELRDRIAYLRRSAGLPDQAELNLFPIQNMKGIEIESFAAKLARVTMWIGHKLAVDKLGVDEPVLPLVDLSEIRQGDALRLPWPRADAIISNPPYHGSQRLRGELGDEYVDPSSQTSIVLPAGRPARLRRVGTAASAWPSTRPPAAPAAPPRAPVERHLD